MKTRSIIIFLIFAMLLAACQPATPITEGVQEEITGETPMETPGDSVPLDQVGSDQENIVKDAPKPEIAWNHDPESLLISGTFCCGFTTPLVPLNYIPDFQVWGDGRYVWVVYNSDLTSRQVLEGQLTDEQLTGLLQQMVDAGFFGWDDRYANQNISDLADKCITVNLESISKSVCEYYEGAPEEFHSFYENFARGNDLTGTEFIPTSGFLTAFEMGNLARPVSEDDILWPGDTLFPLLSIVEKGTWVEGEALQLAWQAVNRDPWSGMVYDGQAFYGLAIQIPGLSMIQPPVETQ